jgi:fructose-specific component phosphotransferase system IIB-like protein
VQVRPVLQARADDVDLVAPEFNIDLEPLSPLMVPARTAPPRPHVAPAPSPTPAASAAEGKPPAPTIAPQLSKAEFAAAQQETNQSLEIAEKNLAATRGKTLNAAQSDLVSKIKGFLNDAREAVRVGDWVLARNLAKKAQVLSEELLRSV